MLTLIKLFFDICLLRANPEDLPYSKLLQGLSIFGYAMVGLAISLMGQSFGHATLAIVVDTCLLLGLAYASLWIRGFLKRSTQTITALAGTGAIFGLVSFPIMVWLQQINSDQPGTVSLLLLILITWNIAVIGHILKSSLSIPFWAGIGIAVMYVYTSLRIISILLIAENVY